MSGGPKRLDLIGQRFGMLVVLDKMPSDKIMTKFNCKCDCGNEKIAVGYELKRGKLKSCGCAQGKPPTTKEFRDHPLYDVWKGMKARCRSDKHISKKNYHDKGVKVCDEWQSDFLSFYNWSIASGWEEGLQLDKDIKSKEMGVLPVYSPETCMWVTAAINNQNRGNVKLTKDIVTEIRGSDVNRREIAAKYGINKSTVDRIKANKIWKN